MKRSLAFRLEMWLTVVAVVLVGSVAPARGARLAETLVQRIARREYRRILKY